MLKSTVRKPRRDVTIMTSSSTLLLLCVLALACGRPRDAVARIGDEWITRGQWETYLGTHPAQGPAEQQERLQDLTRREVAWLRARKAGLLAGSAWEEQARKIRNELLAQFYLRQQKEMAPFTEAEAKEYFKAHNEERSVSHILLATREEADLALVRLRRGEAFDKLARSLSKDPSAPTNGGNLGWIRREQVVKEFGDAVFSAKKGDTLGPIHTQFGWHVIVINDVRQPSDSDFEKNKAAIMARMESMRLQKKREIALEPLRQKMPLKAAESVLNMDRTTQAVPGDEGRVAGRVAGQPITLKELKEFIGEYVKSSGQSHSLGVATKVRFMEMLADDVRLVAAATQSGVDQRPDFKAALWDAEREAGLAVFSRDHLARCVVPDAEMAAFYASHMDLFHGPGALRINVLVVDSMEVAQRAMLEATTGTPWERLFEKYANREATGSWDPGWVEASQMSALVPQDFLTAMLTRPPGHVYGPVQGPEGYEVFRVLEKREGPVLPMGECKDRVRAAYLDAHGAEIVNAYLDGEGRKGIPVRIIT